MKCAYSRLTKRGIVLLLLAIALVGIMFGAIAGPCIWEAARGIHAQGHTQAIEALQDHEMFTSVYGNDAAFIWEGSHTRRREGLPTTLTIRYGIRGDKRTGSAMAVFERNDQGEFEMKELLLEKPLHHPVRVGQ